MTVAALRTIAHSRAGDKGNLNSLSVIAYRHDGYDFLTGVLTPEVVQKHLAFRVTGAVARHACPGLRTLLFVVERDATDTVTTSTFADAHGKSLSAALLELHLEIPDGLITQLRAHA